MDTNKKGPYSHCTTTTYYSHYSVVASCDEEEEVTGHCLASQYFQQRRVVLLAGGGRFFFLLLRVWYFWKFQSLRHRTIREPLSKWIMIGIVAHKKGREHGSAKPAVQSKNAPQPAFHHPRAPSGADKQRARHDRRERDRRHLLRAALPAVLLRRTSVAL